MPVAVLLSLAPWATALAGDELLQHVERDVSLAAGKFEEPCLAMALGDRLEYLFSSDEPLDFNIHYHQEDGIFFPVDKKKLRAHQGEYIASGSRQYCLMWTNRGESLTNLRYRYQLHRVGASQ
jgi:hypothetical protein